MLTSRPVRLSSHPRNRYAERHPRDFLTLIGGGPRYPDTAPTMGAAAHVQRVLDAALRADERRQPVRSG